MAKHIFEYTKTFGQLFKYERIKCKAQTFFLAVRMLMFFPHCLSAAVLLPETAGGPVTTGRRHGAQMAHSTLYTHYTQHCTLYAVHCIDNPVLGVCPDGFVE